MTTWFAVLRPLTDSLRTIAALIRETMLFLISGLYIILSYQGQVDELYGYVLITLMLGTYAAEAVILLIETVHAITDLIRELRSKSRQIIPDQTTGDKLSLDTGKFDTATFPSAQTKADYRPETPINISEGKNKP